MLLAAAAALLALSAPVAGAPAAQAYAATSVTLAQVLERDRSAVGALQPGAYRTVFRTISDNGNAWTVESSSNGRDYRTTVRQAAVSWAYGSSHGQQWREDVNGLVLPSVSFFENEDPFFGLLRAPDASQSGVKLLGQTSGTWPSFVVEIAGRSGPVERRYYDAQTYLLSRVETIDDDGHEQVWLYSDYQRFFGKDIAGLVVFERDGTSVTFRTSLVSYERVPPASIDVTMPPSSSLFDLAGRDAVVIPARFTDDGIIVRVWIEGRGLDCLLDSGSSDLVLDRSVADDLGMASSGEVRMSDLTIANARAPDLSVAGLTARNVAVSTVRLDEHFSTLPRGAEFPDTRIVGLLGTDFIGSGALEIDFKNKTVTLRRSAPADLANRGWSPLPLQLEYGVPLIPAAFAGLPGAFVVDLGADNSTLYPHYVAQFPSKLPGGVAGSGEMFTVAGKRFSVVELTVNRMALGDWIFEGAQVLVPSSLSAQERGYDGLIGRNTLDYFHLIFDYANSTIWFKPLEY